MVYWTEGKDKKARVILGDMEKKTYKVLLSSPIVTEPNLVEYNPSDGYLYFTDADQKTLKKVNPSVGKLDVEGNILPCYFGDLSRYCQQAPTIQNLGLVRTAEMFDYPITDMFAKGGKIYLTCTNNEVRYF